jgi:hypothetical protein
MRMLGCSSNILAFGLILAMTVACGKGDQGRKQASADSAAAAEQEHVDAGVVAASEDDPSRWAPSSGSVAQAKKESAMPPIQMVDDGSADIALGSMPRLPAPPPVKKRADGDEADQYGLPAWEHVARGELRVRRIQY